MSSATPALPIEPPLTSRKKRHVAIPFAICTLIWGSTWIVIRHQIGAVPPGWSIAIRFTIAALAMFAYARVAGIALGLPRRVWPIALIVGIGQFVLNFHFVYRAEAHVTSGIVAMVFALLILPNAILGRIFLGQGLSRAFLIGSAIALVGIALMFHHEIRAASRDPLSIAIGIALSLAATLSASCANIAQATERSAAVPVPALIGWSMAVGALIDIVIAAATEGPPLFALPWSFVAGAAYLGVIGSTVTFPLYFQVIREIGPARAAYSSVLVPIIAMTISTLVEAYVWSVESIVGGALVMAGLVFAIRSRSPAR